MRRVIILIEYFIFLSLLFELSCSNKETTDKVNDFKSLDIDPHKAENKNLSEFAESISYIKLETNDSYLVANISSLTLFNNRFYFLDGLQKVIFCFDWQGKFVFKIDKRGKGPGEYNHLSDFLVDKDTRQLLIYDRIKMEVLFYDLDGEFQRSDQVRVQLAEMGIQDSKSYYFYNYDGFDPSYVLKRIERNSARVISEYILQNKNTDYLRHKVFNHDNERLTFNYGFNDTIYAINNQGSVEPLFVINFKGKSKLFEKLKGIDYYDKEGQKALRIKEDWSNIHYHRSSSNFLYVIYDNNSKLNSLIYSNTSGKYYNIRSVNNDLDGIPLDYFPSYVTDSAFVYIVNPVEIFNLMEENKTEILDYSVSQLQPINEESNPIIAIVQIKKF